MNENWDSIKDTIMDIKKRREETKRKRELSSLNSQYGMDIEDMLVKSLTEEIDKAILKEIMNKFK